MSGNAVDSVLQRLKHQLVVGGDARSSSSVHPGSESASGQSRLSNMLSHRGVSKGYRREHKHIVRFLVMKMSWRGMYRRIMTITRETDNCLLLETYHPETGALTNSWSLTQDVASLTLGGEHPHEGGIFMLTVRKGGGTKEVKFACQERAGLVEVLYSVMYRYVSVGGNVAFVPPSDILDAHKFSKRTQTWKRVLLRMSAIGLDQIDHRTKEVTWRWRFSHVSKPGIRLLGRGGSSCPPGHQVLALFGSTSKSPRVFAFKSRGEFCSAISSVAMKCMGIELDIDHTTEQLDPEDLFTGLATAENEKAITSDQAPLSEWDVLKVKMHHEESVISVKDHKVAPRRLILTRHSFLERNTESYGICEWRSLASIACIIRYAHDPQWIGIEWGDGSDRDVFITKEREALLTSLLYTAQQNAKRPIEVLPFTVGSGHPLIRMHYHPVGTPAIFHDIVTELISLHMLQGASNKFMQSGGNTLSLEALALAALEASPDCPLEMADNDTSIPTMAIGQLEQRILEFNASIPYSGLAKDSVVEHHVIDALFALLPKPMMGYNNVGALSQDEERLVLMALHALQRVCTSTTAKAYILGLGGLFKKVYYCLGCNNDHVSVEAARLMVRFFVGTNDAKALGEPTWSENFGNDVDPMKRHEVMMASRMAKSVCFMTDSRCSSIVQPLRSRTIVSPLLGSVIMEIIVSVACFPGAETTDMATRETMIVEVSSLGRKLFSLFHDSRLPVYDGLALVMRTLAEGGSRAAEPMRQAALQEGAVLTHLRIAMSVDRHASDRITSRELVSLWCDGYVPAMELLKRIFPAGLTVYLDRKNRRGRSNYNTRVESDGNGYHSRSTSGDLSNVYVAGKGHQAAFSFLQGDWSEFWSHVDHDCHHAGLIWNETCRSELRQSLKNEESMLKVGRQKMSEIHTQIPAWNAGDFSVIYSCLTPHIQVGNVYIKLLVDSNDRTVLEYIRDPKDFMSSAYVAFLRLNDSFGSLDMQPRSYPQDSQCLCLKAMSMVYFRYASIVGPFEEISHILSIIDSTGNKKMRYSSLELIHAFICPDHVKEDETIQRIAKENAMRISKYEGISLLCDAAATIHEVISPYSGSSRDTKLITSAFQDVQPKLWFYAEDLALDQGLPENKDDMLEEFNVRKQGPFTKSELRSLFRKGSIGKSTYVSRIGFKYPAHLGDIRELVWWCSEGISPYSEREFALMALDALIEIFRLCPAKDPNSGIQLLPLPICHRQMSRKNCVSRIAQILLTNDPEFVNKACNLLSLYVGQNSDAIKGIYQTGIFFYILAYSGSDLVEPAKFLKLTHLQQKFMQADGTPATCSLSQNSILGDLLPESLLFILESYGYEAFSSAITGNSDTPEIIWTHDMRCQKLIPHLWNHIGDFARLLKESWAISYDYYPCPPIVYEEIEGEIWCHRYYLRHLCNTTQYPNWHIVDHVELLQAMLESWKAELAKVGVQGMSIAQAAELLELDPSTRIDESEMKKAYRRLAKKYHPDRNPAGREQFQLIHGAYVRLHSAREEISGPRDWCILLYLQAQCLLYSGYSQSLAEFKYAGYPYLLASLSLSDESDYEDYDQVLSGKFLPILQSCLHLCWLTCQVSELNAEELMRSNGIKVLETIFSRCVSVTSTEAPPSDPRVSIMVDILKTLGAMAKFESARGDLEGRQSLIKDVIRCCRFSRATTVVSSSLYLIGEMTKSAKARATMIMEGAVITLIPLLFGYDSTIAQENDSQDGGDDHDYQFLGTGTSNVVNTQQDFHKIALLACEVIAKLFSPVEASDELLHTVNLGREAFQALFTPPVAKNVSNSHTFLGYINRPIESHIVIWTEEMRSQLNETLQSLQVKEAEECLLAAADIRYGNLVGETYVSGVYIRLFCENPSKEGFKDVDFCKDLVKVLHTLEHLGTFETMKSSTNTLESPGNRIECKKGESRESMISRNVVLCLRSLQSLLVLSPKLLGLLSTVASIEPIASVLLQGCFFCLPDPRFSKFVGGDSNTEVSFIQKDDILTATEISVAVFLTLSSNSKCLAAIAQPNIPLMISFIILSPPNLQVLRSACECIFNMAEQDAFSRFISEGGLVYLLEFALTDTPAGLQAQDAATLIELRHLCLHSVIKAASNGLHGRKVIIVLEKLFPKGLVAQLLEDEIETVYKTISSSRMTPEVIWNRDMLHELQDTLTNFSHEARLAQQRDLQSGTQNKVSVWNIPIEFMMRYDALQGHTEVDGVFVDLLLETPGHPIRNPGSLLNASLRLFIDECGDTQSQGGETMASSCSVLVEVILLLLSTHPSLADDAISSGHLTRIIISIDDLLSKNSTAAMNSLRIVHAISISSMASEAMARAHPPALHCFMKALKIPETGMQVLALETIKRSIEPSQKARDVLVKSGLDLDLLPALLSILNWKEEGSLEKRSDAINMMRFLCVEIIRLMEVDGPNQDAVRAIIEASSVWAAYRDQRHDMFLPSGASQSNSLMGLLEGAQPYMIAAGESNNTEEQALGDDLIQEVIQQAAESASIHEDNQGH